MFDTLRPAGHSPRHRPLPGGPPLALLALAADQVEGGDEVAGTVNQVLATGHRAFLPQWIGLCWIGYIRDYLELDKLDTVGLDRGGLELDKLDLVGLDQSGIRIRQRLD